MEIVYPEVAYICSHLLIIWFFFLD